MDVLTRPPAIVGAGAALPEGRIRAVEIEARLGLPSGWLLRRTGISELPVAAPDEATSDLAVRAGWAAVEESGISPREIGLVLLATSTPDHLLPPTAPEVAHRLGMTNAGAVDLAGACAGFLYALALADAHGRVRGEAALVIGANVLSRRVNPEDPVTAGLFADGAGAVVLAPGDGRAGILGLVLAADGSRSRAIRIDAGGTRIPLTAERIAAGGHLVRIDSGREVFREAVRGMAESGREALSRAGLGIGDVDLLVPHQANARIVTETARALGIPKERTVDLVATLGNSSAATIPVALAHAIEEGRLGPGRIALLTAVGAGIVRAGVALRM